MHYGPLDDDVRIGPGLGGPPPAAPRRRRVWPYFAAAVVVLLAGGGAVAFYALRPATLAPTVAQVVTPTWDTATLDACREARAFSLGDGAQRHAELARSSAALSDQPVLREIAAKFETPSDVWSKLLDEMNATSASYTVSTWCINHKVPGSR